MSVRCGVHTDIVLVASPQTMRHIASRAELWFEKRWFALLRRTHAQESPNVASVAADGHERIPPGGAR
jgi:hypothetical protein